MKFVELRLYSSSTILNLPHSSSDINPTYFPISDIIWTEGSLIVIKYVSSFPLKFRAEAFCHNLGTYKHLGNIFFLFSITTNTGDCIVGNGQILQ